MSSAVVLDSGQPAKLVLGDGVTAMADLPLIGDLPTKSTSLRDQRNPFASRRITSPATIVVMGVDPAPRPRVRVQPVLWPYTMSNDSGTTWLTRNRAGRLNQHQRPEVVTFKGDLYAMATETATARVGIYRSPNTATVAGWSWTGPWCKPPSAIRLFVQHLAISTHHRRTQDRDVCAHRPRHQVFTSSWLGPTPRTVLWGRRKSRSLSDDTSAVCKGPSVPGPST